MGTTWAAGAAASSPIIGAGPSIVVCITVLPLSKRIGLPRLKSGDRHLPKMPVISKPTTPWKAPSSGGRVFRYNGMGPIEGLPRRTDFISDKSRTAVADYLRRRVPIPFRPADVQTTQENGEYRVQLFGVLVNGEKACVVLEDLPVFFDVWVPRDWVREASVPIEGAPPGAPRNDTDVLEDLPTGALEAAHSRLEAEIRSRLAGVSLCAKAYERGTARKPVGIQLAESPYVRVFFRDVRDRHRAIAVLTETTVGGPPALDTANDTPSSKYIRQLTRHLNIDFERWHTLSNYTVCATPNWAAAPSEPHKYGTGVARAKCRTLRVSLRDRLPRPDGERGGAPPANFVPIDDEKVLKTPLLSHDRTMIATWDLEVMGHGGFPDPRKSEDDIFMASLNFFWKDDKTALYSVIVSTIDIPADPRWDSIICRDERALQLAVGRVFEAFSPEFFTDFNGGNFDWPYFLLRAQRNGVLPQIAAAFDTRTSDREQTAASVLKYGVYGDLDRCLRPDRSFGGERSGRRIKVPENTAYVVHLQTPGCVWYDSLVELWRRHGNKVAAKNLNTFLKANGIEKKTDMPIAEMFRRVKAWRAARDELFDARKAAGVPARLSEGVPPLTDAATEPDAVVEPDAAAEPDAGDRKGRRLRRAEAVYRQKTEACRDVAKYCWWDAASLQAIQVKRSFLADACEVSAMAHMTYADYFYIANGAKVKNMAYAWAERYHGILFSERVAQGALAGKFPGAHVFHPNKGVHRDRPITGLDFSSLYPSLIMAYNLSLEKITRDPAVAKWLAANGHDLHPIEFDYLGEKREGWALRHNSEGPARGLFPQILETLFDRRSGLKKAHLNPLFAELEATDALFTALGLIEDAPAPSLAAMQAAAGDDKVTRGVIQAACEIARRTDPSTEPEPSAVLAAIRARRREAGFLYASVDSRQKALKVYMNTFYGVTGNMGRYDEDGKELPEGTPITVTNPMFMLELAAGVTTAGQRNIKLVAALVEARGWTVEYGDTDSVYVKGPDRIYVDEDAVYAAELAKIDGMGCLTDEGREKLRLEAKERWWTAMVKTTMREVALLRDEVNAALRADNLTGYLRVAYEEVLFPTVLLGKKKYAGIPHEERVNFHPKKYFVRGIDAVVKIGQAKMVHDVADAIIWRALAIDEDRDLREIVETEFTAACGHDWPIEYFERTATYKPEKQNLSVLHFVDRQRRRVENEQAEIAAEIDRYARSHGVDRETAEAAVARKPVFRVPEPGERFSFVIVEPEAEYDLRGRKLSLKTGDLMEFPDVAAALGKRPDVLYYLRQYVAGQCGRFLNYDFEPPAAYAPTDPNARDEWSQKEAVAWLRRRLKELLGGGGATRGYAYKRAFKAGGTDLWNEVQRPLWVTDPDGLLEFDAALGGRAGNPAAVERYVVKLEESARAIAEAAPREKWAKGRIRDAAADEFARLRNFYYGAGRRIPAAPVFRAWNDRVIAARERLRKRAPNFLMVQASHSERLVRAVGAARVLAHAEDPRLGSVIETPKNMDAPQPPPPPADDAATDEASPAKTENRALVAAQAAADEAFARYIACLEIVGALRAMQEAVKARAEREAGGPLPQARPAGWTTRAELAAHSVAPLPDSLFV